MNSLFWEKNQRIEQKIGAEAAKRGTTFFQKDDVLSSYRESMNGSQTISVHFSYCGKDGTFLTRDEKGVLIVMAGELTQEHLPYFRPRLSSLMVGYTFDVKVIRIDEEKKTVYVESVKDSKRYTQGEITKELLKMLNEGKKPRVWGMVNNVTDTRAYVNIVGENVLGIINVKYWQKTYLRSLKTVCKSGEYYAFEVVSAPEKKPGKGQIFRLNREEITGDPWEQIPLDILKPGAVIYVSCVENSANANHWWGLSDIAPGIEIVGLYPNPKWNIDVIEGITYKCHVKEVRRANEENGIKNAFVVRPFAVSEEFASDYQAYMKAKALKMSLDEENREADEDMPQSLEHDTDRRKEDDKRDLSGGINSEDQANSYGAE